jgi:hypothetical protein
MNKQLVREHIKTYYAHFLNELYDSPLDYFKVSDFEYKVIEPLTNINISDHFIFQSKEQEDYFRYIEYPMELYGHSPVSYNGVNNDINKLVFENKDHTITLVGLDELGKSRAATFFFLSRNGLMVNNVKYVLSNDLEKEWENVDIWISDSKKILDTKPENKKFILFQTNYNEHIECDNKINKLNDLNFNG